MEARAALALVRSRCWRTSVQRSMRAVAVVVPLEPKELQLEVSGRPEERLVHALASDGANQSLNEGMRERHERVHGEMVILERF